jgi:hypothetical protein
VLHNFLLLKLDVKENEKSHIGQVREAFAAVGGSVDGVGYAEGQKIGYRHCCSLSPSPCVYHAWNVAMLRVTALVTQDGATFRVVACFSSSLFLVRPRTVLFANAPS